MNIVRIVVAVAATASYVLAWNTPSQDPVVVPSTLSVETAPSNTLSVFRHKHKKNRSPHHALHAAQMRHSLELDETVPGPVSLVNHDDFLFTTAVTIGSNQTLLVDLDTGSSDVWFRGSRCWSWDHSCGRTKPAVQVEDPLLAETDQKWITTYGSGSVRGTIFNGPVTLGGITANINFGVSSFEHGFASPGDGLWGLAFPTLNQIAGGNFIANAGIQSFAFYFSDNLNGDEGELTLNGVDPTKFSGEIKYVPLISDTYYEFSPQGGFFAVNGYKIPMTGDRAIADTGTSLMLIPNDIADQLNEQIGAKFAQGLYNIDCSVITSGPTITVQIGDAAIALSPQQYVLNAGTNAQGINVCVSGISRIGSLSRNGPQYILGDTFLRAAYSVHDIAGNRVGFAQAVHPKRVEHPVVPGQRDEL